jgi:biotin transport system substrate-specific component
LRSANRLGRPVLACLFAALISVGAYIAIPIPGTPVPIVLQNLFVMLAALLLGPRWGLAAASVYLAMGAAGMPVFSGGSGGLARFAGPTGGFLVGYLPAVLATGAISSAGRRRWWKDALAAFVGWVAQYACGIPWLKLALRVGWGKALVAGCYPFIPGDLVKMALAVVLAGRLAPLVEGIFRDGAACDASDAGGGSGRGA